MKFEKKVLGKIESCYSVSSTIINNQTNLLFASEVEGPCYLYSVPEFKQTTIWTKPGGTMSMIPIPEKNGDFLAIQNFIPVFQSQNVQVVWARPTSHDQWDIKKIIGLPYLHRFDILRVGNVNYFIGATLCTTKQFVEDWSDPGRVYVGILPDDLTQPIQLKVIKDGLTRNHGYCRGIWKGIEASFICSDEGVFVMTPPQSLGDDWHVEQLLTRPVSDIALVDIDEDGEDELITIEPFHGNEFVINKKINNDYQIIYKYPKEVNFGHVVWGGKLRGIPTFICAYRSLEKELFYIRCTNKEKLEFTAITIEAGAGPSNIAVVNGKDQDMILAANHDYDEAAVFIVTD